jgi:hypothetical protein
MTLPTYPVLAANATTTIDVTAEVRDGQAVRVSVSSSNDCWVTGDGTTPTANSTGCTVVRTGQWHAVIPVTGKTTRAVKVLNTGATVGRIRVDRTAQP